MLWSLLNAVSKEIEERGSLWQSFKRLGHVNTQLFNSLLPNVKAVEMVLIAEERMKKDDVELDETKELISLTSLERMSSAGSRSNQIKHWSVGPTTSKISRPACPWVVTSGGCSFREGVTWSLWVLLHTKITSISELKNSEMLKS